MGRCHESRIFGVVLRFVPSFKPADALRSFDVVEKGECSRREPESCVGLCSAESECGLPPSADPGLGGRLSHARPFPVWG